MQKRKKLTLNLSSLRELNDEELAAVAGGYTDGDGGGGSSPQGCVVPTSTLDTCPGNSTACGWGCPMGNIFC
jgi:natural product precursor